MSKSGRRQERKQRLQRRMRRARRLGFVALVSLGLAVVSGAAMIVLPVWTGRNPIPLLAGPTAAFALAAAALFLWREQMAVRAMPIRGRIGLLGLIVCGVALLAALVLDLLGSAEEASLVAALTGVVGLLSLVCLGTVGVRLLPGREGAGVSVTSTMNTIVSSHS